MPSKIEAARIKLEMMDEKEEVAYWENQFKQCQEMRQAYETQWFTNLAFYFGKQWAVWKKTQTGGQRLIDPPAPRNRVRLVTNKIKRYIRTELAKLVRQEPIWYVVPQTGEPDDVAGARAAESLTEFVLKETKFKSVRRKATFWMVLTGTGYIKTTCAGLNDPIICESIPTFHIFVPDLQEEIMDNQPYVIHARALSSDTIFKTYGIKVAEDVSTSGATLEQKFFTALGMKADLSTQRKMSYVKEIWVRPGQLSRYPDGAVLVIADSRVVYRYEFDITEEVIDTEADPLSLERVKKKNSYPYKHNEFPFKKLSHIPAGRFYGISSIEDLISLQREYNKTRSQMIEMKNRTSKPPMVYPKGAINPNKVTSEPGQMIGVAAGFDSSAIRYLTVPDFPTYVQNDPGVITADMDFVMSQSEVTHGGAPTGVEASSAISFLSEQNDTTLYWTVADIEDAIEGIGKQCMSLAQQFWNDEKVIKVVSKNYAQDAEIFRMTDINGNTDLRLESGSIAPQSQAAKQAFLLGLADRGFPLEKVLRYLNMNEAQRMYDELQVDSRHAQRENFLMKKQGAVKAPASEIQPPAFLQQGLGAQTANAEMPISPEAPVGEPVSSEIPVQEPPMIDPETGQPVQKVDQIVAFPTNPWDNHVVHIYEHGLFLKSNEFEMLDQETRQVFVAHYLEHEMKIGMNNARTAESGYPELGPGPEQPGAPTGAPIPA